MNTRPCEGGCGRVAPNKKKLCDSCRAEHKRASRAAWRKKHKHQPIIRERKLEERICKGVGCQRQFMANANSPRKHEWCSYQCQRWHRDKGLTKATFADPREYGPAEPLIAPDFEGMKRRALEAACDDVAPEDMHDRFPHGIATWAIGEAIRLGHRSGSNVYSGLRGLPAGLPV